MIEFLMMFSVDIVIAVPRTERTVLGSLVTAVDFVIM